METGQLDSQIPSPPFALQLTLCLVIRAWWPTIDRARGASVGCLLDPVESPIRVMAVLLGGWMSLIRFAQMTCLLHGTSGLRKYSVPTVPRYESEEMTRVIKRNSFLI